MSLFEVNRFTPPSLPGSGQQVEYPAEFHFRILTEKSADAESALAEVTACFQLTAPLAFSRGSSSGRYCAYSVSVRIQSREELNAFEAAVKKVDGVRMLL